MKSQCKKVEMLTKKGLTSIYPCQVRIFLSLCQGDITYSELVRNTPSPRSYQPFFPYYSMQVKLPDGQMQSFWFPQMIVTESVADYMLKYLDLELRTDISAYRNEGFQNVEQMKAEFRGWFTEYQRERCVVHRKYIKIYKNL